MLDLRSSMSIWIIFDSFAVTLIIIGYYYRLSVIIMTLIHCWLLTFLITIINNNNMLFFYIFIFVLKMYQTVTAKLSPPCAIGRILLLMPAGKAKSSLERN